MDIRRQRLGARHPDLAKSQLSLAKCLIRLGRYDEATILLRESRSTFSAVYGPNHEIVRGPEDLLALIERLRRDPSLSPESIPSTPSLR